MMLSTEQREALLALAEAREWRLQPEDVVEAARDPASPLHTAFTWDDEEAAHQHRLDQARYIIRRIRVDVTAGERLIRVPAFVRDPERPVHEQGYAHISRLARDEDAARAAVVAEFVRAAAALRRARDLAAALAVAVDFDALLSSVETARAAASDRPSAAS